jgi:two-component system sensor histidine kinase HydH
MPPKVEPNIPKPFRLVKYFSLTSLVAILIFTIVFSLIIYQRAKTALISNSKEYIRLLAENLNHQVYVQFIILMHAQFGKVQLRDKVQYETLDKVVKNTIHGFTIDEVNIYDRYDDIIRYSTNPSLVGKKGVGDRYYSEAIRGEILSKVISSGSFWDLIWADKGERKLKIYAPFRVEIPLSWETGPILGIFEITQDLSSDYKALWHSQVRWFGYTIGLMGLLFLTLRFIVKRADRIIEKRAMERRELEEQLHQAERLATLGEMVAGISHEIRNPLGIIQSTGELLKSKGINSDQGMKLAEVIVEETNRLNGIVTEFLDFARPQIPKAIPCKLESVIEKNLEFLTPEIEKNRIGIWRRYSKDGGEILADPDLLYRAFLNIFINAIQAMPDGGILSVQIDQQEKGRNGLTIKITDTGEGISEEYMKKVFNPFFTTKQRGSGLGLPIVKNIIESHNGSVEVQSASGSGTSVIIRLPRG